MRRTTFLLSALAVGLSAPAWGASFTSAPILPEEGVDVLNRTVSRERLDRDLFSTPYATVVVGHVDVYERFPYLESRWFQVVSDPAWNRLLYGEVGKDLAAHDGKTSALGELSQPRGLSVDEFDRVYVADSGNHRVLVLQASNEFDEIRLEPVFAIEGLARPFDVAYSDAGTPFDRSDDRLYVADTGSNRVVSYDLADDGATFRAATGELGSGIGFFAGPTALTVGRVDGAHTADVYVADAHNGRIVHLKDAGDRFDWDGTLEHGVGVVTSLDVDHWGHVYAASPSSNQVLKYTASLTPLTTLDSTRPRAFHVPFANRIDHRDGSSARVGRGAGLLVEEWTGETGISLVRLGVGLEEMNVSVNEGVVASVRLTDRGSVTAQVVDDAGRVMYESDLGVMSAGDLSVELPVAELGLLNEGDYMLRVNASSIYEGGDSAQASAPFAWNGSGGAVGNVVSLEGANPNPFRGATSIRFAIPASGARSYSLDVYDVTGRLVRNLGAGAIDGGAHSVSWDGRDSAGRSVAAGVYLTRLNVEGEIETRKMVHLR